MQPHNNCHCWGRGPNAGEEVGDHLQKVRQVDRMPLDHVAPNEGAHDACYPAIVPASNPPQKKEVAPGEIAVAPVPYAARGSPRETDFANAKTTECAQRSVNISHCVVWSSPGAGRDPKSNTAGASSADPVPPKGAGAHLNRTPTLGGSGPDQASARSLRKKAMRVHLGRPPSRCTGRLTHHGLAVVLPG